MPVCHCKGQGWNTSCNQGTGSSASVQEKKIVEGARNCERLIETRDGCEGRIKLGHSPMVARSSVAQRFCDGVEVTSVLATISKREDEVAGQPKYIQFRQI